MTTSIESLEPRRLLAAAAGTLDTTFGHGGAVYVAHELPYQVPTLGGAVTSDGRSLLLGPEPGSANGYHYRVTRLNADGSLDTTFGVAGSFDGATAFDQPGGSASLDSVAEMSIGADGRGRAYLLNPFDRTVTRLTADGTLDETYGVGGSFTLPRLFGANGLLVRPDGTVLLPGQVVTSKWGPTKLAVCKVTPGGRLAASFGRSGVAGVTLRYRGQVQDASANALAVDQQGRIVVAGGGDRFLDLARFDADGSLDKSFAGGGTLRLAPSYRSGRKERAAYGITNDPRFTAVAVRPSDGEIFAATSGETAPQGGQLVGGAWTVAAIENSGRLDPQFGEGGVVRERVGSRRLPAQVQAAGILINGDGQPTVIAGAAGVPNVSGLLMARFGADGRADPEFAPGLLLASADDPGLRLLRATDATDVDIPRAFATGVTSVGDGGFEVALRGTLGGSTDAELTALRFDGGGLLVRAFGEHGVARTAVAAPTAVTALTSLAAASGDRVFAAGATSLYPQDESPAFVTALTADGGVDRSFAAGGSIQRLGETVRALQPDGKLLVDAPPYRGAASTTLLRLNPDGTPDATFGVGGRVVLASQEASGLPLSYTLRVERVLPRPDGSMIAVVRRHLGSLAYVYGSNTDVLYLIDAAGHVRATQDLPGAIYFGEQPGDTDVIVTSDGRVVVPYANFGMTADPTADSGSGLAGVLRFNADLTPDAAVPDAPPPAGLPADFVASGAALPDGSVLFCASSRSGTTPGGVIVRLNADGTFDTSFGVNGTLNVPGGGVPLVQPDGKFLIVPTLTDGTIVVRRFNPDGAADQTFGQSGVCTIHLPAVEGTRAVAASLSPDGTALYLGTIVPGVRKPHERSDQVASVGLLLRVDL